MSRRSTGGFLLLVIGLLVGLGCAGPAQDGGALRIARWFAERPLLDPEGKLQWRPAPAWLTEKTGTTPGQPRRYLEVAIAGPIPDKALCQHGGAILQLSRPIPPGQPFRVSFLARSKSGAKILKVMRRWGGLKRPYWGGHELGGEWQRFTLELCCDRFETEFINFSVVATPRPLLGPFAPGTFCLAEVTVAEVEAGQP